MCVCVCVCVGWGKRGSKWWKHLAPSLLHHLHGLSLCCLSDAGDGGQAVWWLLEFLRLRGGGFWDGAKAEWQSDTTGANVAGAQRWILPSIAFHNAGCVGCKAFTRPAQETTESVWFQNTLWLKIKDFTWCVLVGMGNLAVLDCDWSWRDPQSTFRWIVDIVVFKVHVKQ